MYKNKAEDAEKFIEAQNSIYKGALTMFDEALLEIKQGKKYSHWIWYIFPQLEGLGTSSYCRKYGIAGKDGGCCYLRNDILRNRLVEISEALLNLDVADLRFVMSNVDVMKVRSCITLFYIASIEVYGTDSEEANLFYSLKNKYFNAIGFCDLTLKILYNNGEIDDYIL